jgi:antitoxin (DNA-binding transcriptional repressor) of toxin-antitoxin stability system
MKVVGLQGASLKACINDAQHERVVITQNGKPVALIVGVEGLDAEQLELGTSAEFWKLITQRRRQRTLTREQLEKKISEPVKRRPRATRPRVVASSR